MPPGGIKPKTCMGGWSPALGAERGWHQPCLQRALPAASQCWAELVAAPGSAQDHQLPLSLPPFQQHHFGPDAVLLPEGVPSPARCPPLRQQHRLLAPCRMTFLPQTADERVSAHLLRISPKLCQQGNETGPRSPSLAAAVSHLQPVRPSVRLSVLQSCPAPGRCRSPGALQQNAREMSRRRRRLRAGMLPAAAPGPLPMGRAWVCSRNSQIEGCYPNTQTLQTSDYRTHQFLSFPSFLKSSSSS